MCALTPGQEIGDDCVVYRLIRPDRIKSNGRPSSQNFSDSASDGYMSVFLSDEMAQEGRTVEDLLKGWPGYKACWFTAAQLWNELHQVLVRRPIPDFPGHAGVRDTRGRRSNRTRSLMAEAARWYERPATAPD